MAATSIEFQKLHSGKGRTAGADKGVAATKRKPFDMKRLAWPSGRGDEFGVVFANGEALWKAILKNGNKGLFEGVNVVRVEEAEAHAVMLEGLSVGPVSFASEPGMPKDRLAIIADAKADRAALQRHLNVLLLGLRLVF